MEVSYGTTTSGKRLHIHIIRLSNYTAILVCLFVLESERERVHTREEGEGQRIGRECQNDSPLRGAPCGAQYHDPEIVT